MKLSLKEPNVLFSHFAQAVARQLRPIKEAIGSTSQLLRVNLNNDVFTPPEEILEALRYEEVESTRLLQKYGGNIELFNLVKGIQNGTLYPVSRVEFPPIEEADETYVKTFLGNFLWSPGTMEMWYMTINGPIFIGKIDEEHKLKEIPHGEPYFYMHDKKCLMRIRHVFFEGKPEELDCVINATSGTYGWNDRHGMENVLFDGKETAIMTNCDCNMVGRATLELGHPPVSFYGFKNEYLDRATVIGNLKERFPVSTEEEIFEKLYQNLELLRNHINAISYEDARVITNEIQRFALVTGISIEGYRSKTDPVVDNKDLFKLDLHINTHRNFGQVNVTYGKNERWTAPFNEPFPPTFFAPLGGPALEKDAEGYEERRKLDSRYVSIGLVRLNAYLSHLLTNKTVEVKP